MPNLIYEWVATGRKPTPWTCSAAATSSIRGPDTLRGILNAAPQQAAVGPDFYCASSTVFFGLPFFGFRYLLSGFWHQFQTLPYMSKIPPTSFG